MFGTGDPAGRGTDHHYYCYYISMMFKIANILSCRRRILLNHKSNNAFSSNLIYVLL